MPSSNILLPVMQVGCCMTLRVTAVTQQHMAFGCRVAGEAPAKATVRTASGMTHALCRPCWFWFVQHCASYRTVQPVCWQTLQLLWAGGAACCSSTRHASAGAAARYCL